MSARGQVIRDVRSRVVGVAAGARGAGEGGEGGEGKGEGRSPGEGAGAQGESAAMLAMMESMWRVSLLDIESTLRHACNKVLSDQSVDKAALKARARALVLMGRIFQSYGSADALKSVDFSQHMQQVGERMAGKVAEQNEREQNEREQKEREQK